MKLKKIDIGKIDSFVELGTVFIGCSSFESRCLSIVNSISGNKISKAIITYNEDILPYLKVNNEAFEKIFADKIIKAVLRTDNPVFTADNLRNAIEKNIFEEKKILIDITTFTHESLLILIKLFSIVMPKHCKVSFVYTSADSYGKHDETNLENEIDNIWLSKGVEDIRNVLGFSGELLPSRETHLIVLVGFEYERAIDLIREYEPDYLTLGFGKASGSISEKHHKANKKFHSLLNNIASSWQKVDSFEFSCNDPLETQKAIIDQSKMHSDTNIVVAPMNTKISTIGTYLANQENEAIQVCYAKPSVYNYENYSIPGKSCYILELPELFK